MKKQKGWCVYMHTTPSGKKYVGITSYTTTTRWGCDGGRYKRNPYFWNAIQKYGWDNIKHEVLYENLTEEEAKEAEIRLIAQYDASNPAFGYNMTKGGEGTSGRKRTEAEKEAIRQGHLGKPLSEETKKKIGDSNRGKTRHGGGRPKGYKLSDETKRRISEAGKGHVPWNKGLKGLKGHPAWNKSLKLKTD